MKKYRINIFFILLIIFSGIKAQTPQKINYQAIARDGVGNLVTSSIGIRFDIYQGSVGGTLLYQESHVTTPSSSGVFTVSIGGGTPLTGNFASINWAFGPIFLSVNIDPTGGTSYSNVGSNQLVSVPYSLYSERAANVINYVAGTGIGINTNSIINTAPDIPITIASGTNVSVTGTYPFFTVNSTPSLNLIGNQLGISGGNTVTLPSSGTVTPVPLTNLTYSGNINISSVGTNSFHLTVPNNSLSLQSDSLFIQPGGNYIILPTKSNTITGTGIAVVTPSVGSTFNINVPAVSLNYTPANGVLLYSPAPGTASINLTPNLTYSSNILFVGSNSVSIPGTGLWTRPTTTTTSLFNTGDYVGIGTTNPSEKLQVQTGGNSDISIVATGSNRATLNLGSNLDHFKAGISYHTGTNNMDITSNSITNRIFFDQSGRIAMGYTTTTSELDINGSLRLAGSRLFLGPVGGINSGYTGIYENSGDLKLAVFKSGAPSNLPFATGNSFDAITIKNTTGFVGIGTVTPTAPLEVNGKIISDSIQLMGSGTPTIGSILTSRDALGNAKWVGPVIFKANFAPFANTTINTATIGLGGTIGYSSSTAVNIGNALTISASNMFFTAPIGGAYNLSASLIVALSPAGAGNNHVYLEIYNISTGMVIGRAHSNCNETAFYYTTLKVSTVAALLPGQQVGIRVGGLTTNAGSITTNYSPNLINEFNGFLIR